MLNYLWTLLAITGTLLTACTTSQESTAESSPPQEIANREKFEPADGECIVFVGQELEAIGGLETFNDGYFDHFAAPGGFTMYTDLMSGAESFGFTHKGLNGLTTTDDWGDGPSNMSLQVVDSDFANSALAIGLDMKYDNEDDVARGDRDSLILVLGEWIKAQGKRPVFLRIGYEFDGHGWNSYDREDYITAFRRIRDMYDSLGIDNIAYTWQSKGRGSFREELDQWYPGDDYVDWCAMSFFAPDNEKHPMIQFARDHNKPLFIAESTPILTESTESFVALPMNLAIRDQAQQAWDDWFTAYFRTIDSNPDVVKAVSYIYCRWNNHPMWAENDYFKVIDARIHLDEKLSTQWETEISKEKYLNASPDLFEYLWTGK